MYYFLFNWMTVESLDPGLLVVSLLSALWCWCCMCLSVIVKSFLWSPSPSLKSFWITSQFYVGKDDGGVDHR